MHTKKICAIILSFEKNNLSQHADIQKTILRVTGFRIYNNALTFGDVAVHSIDAGDGYISVICVHHIQPRCSTQIIVEVFELNSSSLWKTIFYFADCKL